MDQDEINNLLETFKASLDSIFQEKLESETWREKLKGFSAKVNIAIVAKEGVKIENIYVHIIAQGTNISVTPGKIDDAEFELAASFETFFNIATGSANSILELLKGKLKVKEMLKNMKKVLFLNKLMVLEKK
nr:SCP2 sterol-binding domain-containing protein [Candidatus Sigynarchaeota archaeon]